MICRLPLFLSLLFLAWLPAHGEDLVYESISGVTIGRVFLSQQERDQLDDRRLENPQGENPRGAGPSTAGPKSKPAQSAGYIIGRSGHSKFWKDGDFVESQSNAVRSMSFPGDVKVTRHEIVEESVTGNEDDTSPHDNGPDNDASQK